MEQGFKFKYTIVWRWWSCKLLFYKEKKKKKNIYTFKFILIFIDLFQCSRNFGRGRVYARGAGVGDCTCGLPCLFQKFFYFYPPPRFRLEHGYTNEN